MMSIAVAKAIWPPSTGALRRRATPYGGLSSCLLRFILRR
jgi:hypothetical protein